MYSNLRGCDGERVYYGVHSLIAVNGDVVAISDQFSLREIVSDIEGITMYSNL